MFCDLFLVPDFVVPPWSFVPTALTEGFHQGSACYGIGKTMYVNLLGRSHLLLASHFLHLFWHNRREGRIPALGGKVFCFVVIAT